MSERLGAKDVITRPRAVAVALLASLAIAGCGNTRSADNEPVGTCGHHDYSKAGSSRPVESVSQVLGTAGRNVITLQARALQSGGSIDLPRYDNDTPEGVVEITASRDNLRLSFDRSGWLATPRVDHVNFPISGVTAHVAEGAVACFDDNNQLVVNGTYAALQEYVHETAVLEK